MAHSSTPRDRPEGSAAPEPVPDVGSRLYRHLRDWAGEYVEMRASRFE